MIYLPILHFFIFMQKCQYIIHQVVHVTDEDLVLHHSKALRLPGVFLIYTIYYCESGVVI